MSSHLRTLRALSKGGPIHPFVFVDADFLTGGWSARGVDVLCVRGTVDDRLNGSVRRAFGTRAPVPEERMSEPTLHRRLKSAFRQTLCCLQRDDPMRKTR